MNALILKTDISTAADFDKVKSLFNQRPEVYECTIDLDDVDKIVRILTNGLTIDEAESKIQNLGFFCKELEDE